MPGDWLVRFDEGSLRFQTPEFTGTIPAFYSMCTNSDRPRRGTFSTEGVPRRSRATREHLITSQAVTNEVVQIHTGGARAHDASRQPVQPCPAWGVLTAEMRGPGDSTVPGGAAKHRANEKLNHTAARKGLPVRPVEDGAEPRMLNDDGYRRASGFYSGKSPPCGANTTRPGGRADIVRSGP